MTLIQQHQSDLEDELPLVERLSNNRSSPPGENYQMLTEIDDNFDSKYSRKPLLDRHNENDRDVFYDEDDSEEEIDTRLSNDNSVTGNNEMNKSEKRIFQHGKMPNAEQGRITCVRLRPAEADNGKDEKVNNKVLPHRNSLSSQKSLTRSSSKNKLCGLQSMDRKIESLKKEWEAESSSVIPIVIPPSEPKNSSFEASESNEQSRLLQPQRPMSTSNGYGATAVDADDADSVHSVFRGALDVDVLEIPWESDVNRVVDVQTGGEEWQTNINPVEGGLHVDDWESKIIEMSKGEDKFGPDIWSTAVHELPKDTQVHEEWGSEIAGKMTNDADPFDWSTKFNRIAKIKKRENIWKTKLQKIQNQSADTEKWKSTFNAIGMDTADDMRKTRWKIKIPKRIQDLPLKSDWSTTINHTKKLTEGEVWKNRFSKILLRSDDRKTHWKTKFLSIQNSEDHLNPWRTIFREIAPRKIGEPETWTSAFYSISEERDLPEHWNTTFTRIEHLVDENDWSVTIEDIPDDFRDPSDWATGFNTIENHESNLLWDTSFNNIIKDHASERIWTSNFLQADITDTSRHKWEIHPTNNPVDKG